MTILLILSNVALVIILGLVVVSPRRSRKREDNREPKISVTSDGTHHGSYVPGMTYRARGVKERRLTSVAGESEKLIGMRPEELTGGSEWSLSELVHPDDRDLVDREIERAIDGETEFRINYRIATKDGKWRWVCDSGAATYTRGGEPGLIEGHLLDISDRVSAEFARVRAEEKYHLLARHARDIICVHDSDGRFEYISPSVKHTLGYDPGELKERGFYALIHPEDRKRVLNKINRHVRTDCEVVDLQYRIRSKSGAYVHMETLCSPKQDAEGYYTKFVTSSRDVTRLERLGRELDELRQIPEGLDNEALRVISDEMRAPMTGIMGFVDLLNDGLAEEHQKTLELIRASGNRMLSTFKSMMDFSAIDSEPAATVCDPINVVPIAVGEADRYRTIAAEKGLTFQLVQESNFLEAELNADSVSRIMDQLLSNAVKFTPEDGVVTVSVLDEGDDVLLRVSDTGIGISREFLPHVYEPFRQESSGLAREYEGVGIGLSIAKRLTGQLNGEIDVNSIKNKGTTVSVRLPKCRNTSSETPETADAVVAETPQPPPEKQRLRVLAVDDNEPMRLILRRHLAKEFEVETASDADEAIALATASKFDVIVLDINLGTGRSGQEILDELRTLPDHDDVFVIAVTAYALPEEKSRFLRAGFDGYVSKPFTSETLLREITRLTMQPIEIEQAAAS